MRLRRQVLLAVAAFLACATPVAARGHGGEESESDRSAERAYVSAVQSMRDLESPPYATYDALWRSTGLGFDFSQDDERIVIDVGFGRSFVHERRLAATYRAADRVLQLSVDGTQKLEGHGRLLEPTWAGAYDLLRFGLRGDAPVAQAPAPEASPAPQPTEIATVTAIAPFFYRVSDEGLRPCPGGTAGRALHLVARKSARDHPLTDVVLDPATGRFCSMTFVVKESGLAGVTGHYTIEFSPFGSYWLVSHGLIDVDVRLFGIAAKHATLSWTIDNVATSDGPLASPVPAAT